jgi:hypothetical protein
MTVDRRAGEGLTPEAAFQFFGRLIGRRNRERSEAGQSCRLFRDRFGQRVIGVAHERHRLRRFQLLDTWRGQRDDLHVDPSGIDLGDPRFSDVAQVAHQPLGAATDLAGLFLQIADRTVEKVRRGEMLF